MLFSKPVHLLYKSATVSSMQIHEPGPDEVRTAQASTTSHLFPAKIRGLIPGGNGSSVILGNVDHTQFVALVQTFWF